MWYMLEIVVFIVYISAVSGCLSQFSKNSVQTKPEVEQKEYIRIMVKSSSSSNKYKKVYSEPQSSFYYTAGEMLECTCITSEKSDPELQWKINHHLYTETGNRKHDKLRLWIKPFVEDSGTNISCHSGGRLSVTLNLIGEGHTSNKSIVDVLEPERQTRLIEEGSQVNISDICPTKKYSQNIAMVKLKGKEPTQFKPRQIIIKNFTSNDNDTEIDCQYLTNRNYTGQYGAQVLTFERERTLTYLYLNEQNTTVNESANADLGPTVGPPGESVNKPSDGPNIIVMAGSLGAVIFLLLLVIILFICFRKKRQHTFYDGDTVVYAEMQERPSQLPPPRNDDPPYATIIGTLVPNPNTNEECLYSIVT